MYIGEIYLGWAQALLREYEVAAASLAHAAEIGQAFGGRPVSYDRLLLAEGDLAVSTGRIGDALELAGRAAEYSRDIGSIFSEGYAHRLWARVLAKAEPPQWEEAEAHLANSLNLFEQGDAVLEAARTQQAWGILCRDQGNQAAAREHMEQAAAKFEKAGLAGELAKTKQELASLAAVL